MVYLDLDVTGGYRFPPSLAVLAAAPVTKKEISDTQFPKYFSLPLSCSQFPPYTILKATHSFYIKHLRWFVHIERMESEELVKEMCVSESVGPSKGRPPRRWRDR